MSDAASLRPGSTIPQEIREHVRPHEGSQANAPVQHGASDVDAREPRPEGAPHVAPSHALRAALTPPASHDSVHNAVLAPGHAADGTHALKRLYNLVEGHAADAPVDEAMYHRWLAVNFHLGKSPQHAVASSAMEAGMARTAIHVASEVAVAQKAPPVHALPQPTPAPARTFDRVAALIPQEQREGAIAKYRQLERNRRGDAPEASDHNLWSRPSHGDLVTPLYDSGDAAQQANLRKAVQAVAGKRHYDVLGDGQCGYYALVGSILHDAAKHPERRAALKAAIDTILADDARYVDTDPDLRALQKAGGKVLSQWIDSGTFEHNDVVSAHCAVLFMRGAAARGSTSDTPEARAADDVVRTRARQLWHGLNPQQQSALLAQAYSSAVVSDNIGGFDDYLERTLAPVFPQGFLRHVRQNLIDGAGFNDAEFFNQVEALWKFAHDLQVETNPSAFASTDGLVNAANQMGYGVSALHYEFDEEGPKTSGNHLQDSRPDRPVIRMFNVGMHYRYYVDEPQAPAIMARL